MAKGDFCGRGLGITATLYLITLICLGLLMGMPSPAKALIIVQKDWEATYSHRVSYYPPFPCAHMVVDRKGDVYVTGRLDSEETNEVAILKYSASTGTALWETLEEGVQEEYYLPSGLALGFRGLLNPPQASRGRDRNPLQNRGVNLGGFLYVAIAKEWITATSKAYLIVKYNATTGHKVWEAMYGEGDGMNRPFALAVDQWGNVYVTGSSGNLDSYDYLTVKYNRHGETVWVKRYDVGENEAWASDLAVDSQGNVYVTGYANSDSERYIHTAKYNPDGSIAWVNTYQVNEYPVDLMFFFTTPIGLIALDGQNNVYVTGQVKMPPYGDDQGYDYITIKYNSAGVKLWATDKGILSSPPSPSPSPPSPSPPFDIGKQDNSPAAMEVDAEGNVYVTGSANDGGQDGYGTVKYNPDGEREWDNFYFPPGGEDIFARDLTVDGLGNVYITGDESYLGSYQIHTIMLNSSGERVWHEADPGRQAVAICLGPQTPSSRFQIEGPTVYVLGFAEDDVFSADLVLRKYRYTELEGPVIRP